MGPYPPAATRRVTSEVDCCIFQQEVSMFEFLKNAWSDEHGQDIAEYAVMVAVILVVVVGTIRLIGSHSNTVFSNVASAVQ
jgi:Flp pilus assembly pilin Flp